MRHLGKGKSKNVREKKKKKKSLCFERHGRPITAPSHLCIFFFHPLSNPHDAPRLKRQIFYLLFVFFSLPCGRGWSIGWKHAYAAIPKQTWLYPPIDKQRNVAV